MPKEEKETTTPYETTTTYTTTPYISTTTINYECSTNSDCDTKYGSGYYCDITDYGNYSCGYHYAHVKSGSNWYRVSFGEGGSGICGSDCFGYTDYALCK